MGGCIETARTTTISRLSLVNEDAMKQLSRAVKMNHGYLLENIEEAQKQDEYTEFINQIKQINFPLVNKLIKDLIIPFAQEQQNNQEEQKVENKEDLKPIPNEKISRLDQLQGEKLKQVYDKGLESISLGQVAVVLTAGGKGTRLGFEKPKGEFNLKLPSNKTLFQIFSEKLRKIQQLASQQFEKNVKKGKEEELIHFYIMTSDATDEDTKKYFSDNYNFGLSNVHFFKQANLPVIDKRTNKIMFKDKFLLQMSPDGNGGFYQAIAPFVPEMKKQGIKWIHVIGVDNVLNKLADPVLIGTAELTNSQLVSKFIKKVDPNENVGLHILNNGKFSIIEYSEAQKIKALKNEQGEDLLYHMGYMATFLIKINALENLLATKDEWEKHHIALKKVSYYDDSQKKTINPEEKLGIQLEKFIFDAFGQIQDFHLLEVQREAEFAPLKNSLKEKTDNENTAKELISKLHYKWLKDAGFQFNENVKADKDNICEVHPLVSYNGEGLDKLVEQYKEKFPITSLPFEVKAPEEKRFLGMKWPF